MSFQAQFLSKGETIDYTPDAAVAGGTVVIINGQAFVAIRDIAAGEQGALRMAGEFDFVKDTSTFAVGDAMYWDADGDPVDGEAGTGAASTTATGNTHIGSCTAAAATGVAKVRGNLNNMTRTTTIAGSMTATDITGSDASLAVAGLSAAQGGAVAVAGGPSATAGLAGGAVSLTGGVPGATGVGGAASVVGGIGGSTSGTGGAASLAGGAGTAGNGAGGAASVLGGNAHGNGADGAVNVGTSNTSAVNIGAASIPANIAGPVTASVGASTAAAGNAVGNAGALPAGTAGVYPTTAADDAKGVVIDVADQVTGRQILIGNGVSNKILKVYGPSGAVINGAAPDAAFSSASGKGVIAVCLSGVGNTWLMW